MKQHVLAIPKANRNRLFEYNWKKGAGGGWQTIGGWLLDQLDPPWQGRLTNDTDFDGKFYYVKVTQEGIGKIVGALMEHGGFADLLRREVWPIIADYIDDPPKPKRTEEKGARW